MLLIFSNLLSHTQVGRELLIYLQQLLKLASATNLTNCFITLMGKIICFLMFKLLNFNMRMKFELKH